MSPVDLSTIHLRNYRNLHPPPHMWANFEDSFWAAGKRSRSKVHDLTRIHVDTCETSLKCYVGVQNSTEPDQMQQNVASDQDLHCLAIYFSNDI